MSANDKTEPTDPVPAASRPPIQPTVAVPDLNQGLPETEDEKLLARPAEVTIAADTTRDAWRVFRIMGEFVEGFDTLAQVGPAVSVFGSARTPWEDPHYAAAEEMGRRLTLVALAPHPRRHALVSAISSIA